MSNPSCEDPPKETSSIGVSFQNTTQRRNKTASVVGRMVYTKTLGRTRVMNGHSLFLCGPEECDASLFSSCSCRSSPDLAIEL